MILETAGTGLIMPVLSYLTDPTSLDKYPLFNNAIVYLDLNTQTQIVLFLLLILIIPNFLKFFLLIFLSHYQSKFTYDFQTSLSKRMFKCYLNQPYSFHLNRNSSALLQVVTAEVNTITTMTNQAMVLLTDVSILISILLLLLFVEPFGAISAFLTFTFFGYLFYVISKKYLKKWGKERQIHETLGIKHLQQGLGGIKDIKILGKEQYFTNKFGVHRDMTANVNQKQMFISQMPRVWLEFLTIMSITVMILVLVFFENNFTSMIPVIGLFIAAAFKIIPSINRIISSFQIFAFSIPAINIVFDELKLESDIQTNIESKSISEEFVKLEINKLNFFYSVDKKNILKNINFSINRGDLIGIIGKSGEGKSTLIDLILGLLKPISGQILINGKDLFKNKNYWQKKIGYVPQNIFLTDDSLKRNIAFGQIDKSINNERLNNAIISAQLDDFVNNSHEGVNTIVGERGVKLSGGQRQRIGIARALYNNPDILVLDEATSSLDMKTEKEVMKSINLLSKSKTIIIVTHRLSTVENVDYLYEIDAGKLILKDKSDLNYD